MKRSESCEKEAGLTLREDKKEAVIRQRPEQNSSLGVMRLDLAVLRSGAGYEEVDADQLVVVALQVADGHGWVGWYGLWVVAGYEEVRQYQLVVVALQVAGHGWGGDLVVLRAHCLQLEYAGS